MHIGFDWDVKDLFFNAIDHQYSFVILLQIIFQPHYPFVLNITMQINTFIQIFLFAIL